MEDVLTSTELMRKIFVYQHGIYEVLIPLIPLTRLKRNTVVLHHLLSYYNPLKRNSMEDIADDLKYISNILDSWYRIHQRKYLEKAIEWNEQLVRVFLFHSILSGEIDVVKWIVDEFELTTAYSRFGIPLDTLGDIAAANNQLAMLQYLTSLGGSLGTCSSSAFTKASQNGHLSIVKYLHGNSLGECTTAAMDTAAANNHMDIIKFLHANRTEGCTGEAIALAASNGHFDMIQWLHNNLPESFNGPFAMNLAAEHGHLNIVQFLHTFRSEGCTVAAMDNAAKNGHLDIVRFLNSNRCEGCTFVSIEWMKENWRTEIVEYLAPYLTDVTLSVLTRQ